MHRFVPIPPLFVSLIPHHTFASLLHFGTFQRFHTLVPNSCPLIQVWDFRRIWLYPRNNIDVLWTQYVFEMQGSQVTPKELYSFLVLEKKYTVKEYIAKDAYILELMHMPTGIVCTTKEFPTSSFHASLPLANAYNAVKKAVSEFTPEKIV